MKSTITHILANPKKHHAGKLRNKFMVFEELRPKNYTFSEAINLMDKDKTIIAIYAKSTAADGHKIYAKINPNDDGIDFYTHGLKESDKKIFGRLNKNFFSRGWMLLKDGEELPIEEKREIIKLPKGKFALEGD